MAASRVPPIFVLTFITAVCMVTGQEAVHADTCLTDGQVSDLTACLQQISADMQNTSLFWFGTSYNQTCPNGPDGTQDCTVLITSPESMAYRIFGNHDFNGDTLERFLNVSYTSPAGEYTECDTVISHQSSSFNVDPVNKSPSEQRPTWYYRNTPSVSWHSHNSNAMDTDNLYTLLVVDAGFGFMHGIYTNIRGSELGQNATIERPYHGPRYFGGLMNPYAFLLYRQQTVNMQLNPKWMVALSNPVERLNITGFAEDQNLTEPVGVSWIQVTGDLYGQKQMNDAFPPFLGRFVQNCASHVQKDLEQHNRTFLPAMMKLSVWMSISITSPPITVEACCRKEDYGEKTFPLDPLANPTVTTAETRTGVTFHINLEMNKMFPHETDFIGKTYSLIILDPDVPQDPPFLHGLTMNMPSGDYENGTPIKTYLGPEPSDFLPHQYYFLLYEQQGMEDLNDTMTYSATTEEHAGRVGFKINEFVRHFNLTLVGASWFKAETDLYVVERSSPNDTDRMCRRLYGEDYCH